MRIPVILLPVFAAFLSIASAQQGDIRLSPPEQPFRTLPAPYRIQAADRAGTRSLIVWGTTRSLNRKQVAGELRYQILEGTTPLGSQAILTDTSARPFDFVQVIPGPMFFLVVWRDAREGASGLYAQRIDVNGNLLGKAIRISPGFVQPSPTVSNILVFGDNDRLLIWKDGRQDSTGLYAIHLSRNGALDIPAIKIGNDLRGVVRFSRLPSLTVLRTGDTTAKIIYGNGEPEPREIRWPASGIPYHLGPDTSLVTLAGKHLNYFSSIFASAPVWSVDLNALDTAVANSAMITRDSAAGIRVFFSTLHIAGEFPDLSGTVNLRGYATTVSGPQDVGVPALHYEKENYQGMISPSDLSGFFAAYAGPENYIQGYDNTQQVGLKLRWTTYTHGYESTPRDDIRYFSIDPDGTFHPDSTGLITSWLSSSSVSVSRTAVDSISRVAVRIADTTLLFSAPVAEINPSAGQQMPRLTSASDNKVLCYWQDERIGNRTLYRTTLPFRDIALPGDTFSSPEVNANHMSGTDEGEWCSKLSSKTGMYLYPDFFVYSSNQRILCHQEMGISYSPYFKDFYSQFSDLYFPGDTSWSSFSRHITSPNENLTKNFSLESWTPAGYDPNRKEVLATIDQSTNYEPYNHSHWSLAALDHHGRIAWRVDTLPLNSLTTLLPVDSLRYLNITGSSATLYHKHTVVAAYTLPDYEGSAYYQPLLGPFFLRSSETIPQHFRRLELYSLEGELTGEAEIPLDLAFASPHAIQRPSDSALVVLWGTENDGIHAAILDKRLKIIVADTLVNATRSKALNPSGTFSGDTLYVVWEDYRNGDADIYGTGFLPPPTETGSLTVTEHKVKTELRLYVHPNPARGPARAEFNHPVETAAKLELFDVTGSLLWCGGVESGSRAIDLPLDNQPPGIYWVRWHTATQYGFEKLLVLTSNR